MADIEKVIKGLECCLKESDHLYSNPCNGCPYEGQECIDRMKSDALALLKEDCHNCKLECLLQKYDQLKEKYDKLLKEHEPKPIVYTENPYTGLPVAHCPKCGEPIQLYAYGNGAEQNYCPYCGQALKWDEE